MTSPRRAREAGTVDWSAPAYPEHDGRLVRWQPWQEPLWVSHLDLICDQCGQGRPWSAVGLLPPSADDSDDAVWRLVAYRCPVCADLVVYALGGPDRFVEVTSTRSTQPELFDPGPARPRPPRAAPPPARRPTRTGEGQQLALPSGRLSDADRAALHARLAQARAKYHPA